MFFFQSIVLKWRILKRFFSFQVRASLSSRRLASCPCKLSASCVSSSSEFFFLVPLVFVRLAEFYGGQWNRAPPSLFLLVSGTKSLSKGTSLVPVNSSCDFCLIFPIFLAAPGTIRTRTAWWWAGPTGRPRPPNWSRASTFWWRRRADCSTTCRTRATSSSRTCSASSSTRATASSTSVSRRKWSRLSASCPVSAVLFFVLLFTLFLSQAFIVFH